MKISKDDLINVLIVIAGIAALMAIILMGVYLFTMNSAILAFSKWMMGVFGFSMISYLTIELKQYL